MTTKALKRLPKTTLSLLRSKLTDGEEERQVRLSWAKATSMEKRGVKVNWAKDTSYAYGPKKFPARLKVKTVAAWLGCSQANVGAIESAKAGRKLKNGERQIRQLTPEQADIVAYQTDINLRWLLNNDVSQTPINSLGKPYIPKDFDRRQAEIKSGKSNFSNPSTLRHMIEQVNRLAEDFAMVTAIMLQGLDRGQADIYDYKLRRALRKVYDFHDEQGAREWQALGLKAIFHGKPTLTRPDVDPLLDEWETRFKEIASRKSGPKAPLRFPRRTRSLPALHPPTHKQARKAARHPHGRKPAKRNPARR